MKSKRFKTKTINSRSHNGEIRQRKRLSNHTIKSNLINFFPVKCYTCEFKL